MSRISQCRTCGGNVVEPAYPGDGVYPVAPMCSCNDATKKAPYPWCSQPDVCALKGYCKADISCGN